MTPILGASFIMGESRTFTTTETVVYARDAQFRAQFYSSDNIRLSVR